MDKDDTVYSGVLLTHKKEWNNATCSDIDGPWDYHIKWSKLEKDYGMTYMWNIKKKLQMNLLTNQK